MALHLEEDAKEEQDDHRLRIGVSPAHDRLSGYAAPPATFPVAVCTPRSSCTLPPTLNKQGSSEPKKRRLWGLRGLVKMFRRRTRRKGIDSSENHHSTIVALRTRSASELAVDQSVNRTSTGPYNQGLSVSHDSVFAPESPTEDQRASTSNLAIVTRGVNMSELKAALRRRRTEDSGSPDDDLGLPRSPPTSPNTYDVLSYGFKNSSRATQSSCSDASLLSMGSSEYDEDSFGSLSHHSSRASLIEGRNYSIDNEPAVGTVTLSHNAARHKMAVRPRRTHASSKMRKQAPIPSSPLPTTIEVNEEYVHKSSEGLVQETHLKVHSSRENLATKGEFHARDAVEALVLELVTEKSKSYFSRSFEERSTNIISVDSITSRNLTPPHGHILVEELHQDLVKSNVNKERNKSDPTAFSKRISIGESSRSCVKSQRASSLEGYLDDVTHYNTYFTRQVLNDESQVELRGNLNTTVDSFATSASGSQTSKTMLSTTNDFESSVHDEDNVIPQVILPDEKTKTLLGAVNSREPRSSIDNLTTTLLPGIYIRPFSPNTNQELIGDVKTEENSNNFEIMTSYSNNLPCGTRNTDTDISTQKDTSSEEYIVGYVLPKEEDTQLSSDSKLCEMKKVKREHSFTSHDECKAKKVPEFMRVQLNRVKSFNTSVVLNTGSQQSAMEKDLANLPPKTKDGILSTSPVQPSRKDVNKFQEPISELPITLKDTTAKEKPPTVLELITRDDTKVKEEIVLRRPSILDKSVILDQNTSKDQPKERKSDQPELMKVFARRSFKLKDNDTQDTCDNEKPEISSETESKKVEPQINAIKRYSIGSCPMPFGTRFADTNIISNKSSPIEAHEQNLNADKLPCSMENSSLIGSLPNNEESVQNLSISEQRFDSEITSKIDSEIMSKMVYPRRSFSHVALKSVQTKTSLGRTSSANQSDFVVTSAIINRSAAINSEKTKEIIDKKPSIEVKPAITTKPVVWPPVKSCSDSPPKIPPVDVNKALSVISTNSHTTTSVCNININDTPKDIESKENFINKSKLLNRIITEAPRKVSLAEARNTSFSQSMIVENARKNSFTSKNDSEQRSESVDEQAVDWRVLVRKRREDRLKHTKSTDPDEIIMETRPNTNRNSKVLEMANNFQKMQVA